MCISWNILSQYFEELIMLTGELTGFLYQSRPRITIENEFIQPRKIASSVNLVIPQCNCRPSRGLCCWNTDFQNIEILKKRNLQNNCRKGNKLSTHFVKLATNLTFLTNHNFITKTFPKFYDFDDPIFQMTSITSLLNLFTAQMIPELKFLLET